jgi:hypothetical protein
VIVRDDLATPLADALAQGGASVGLQMAERHPASRATFGVHAEVYSREVAARLRDALRSAPKSQHSESEEAHAQDTGVELYAPAHAYTYRVRATVDGPVGDVLAVRRRLADVEAAQIEPLHLA